MAQPNFFIIGAPKCGTTSLATWLSAHPQVFMSPIKEPHHFNTDMQHQIVRDRIAYDALFDNAGAALQIGEASVWYLYSHAAVPNIESYNPRARYIVCLRNPVDMAYSLYHQQVFSGSESATSFEEAWRSADARKKGSRIPRRALDPATVIYPKTCALGEQVERLLQHVPSERVCIVTLEEMIAAPHQSFELVQRFLGLEINDSVPLSHENAAKVRRSKLLLAGMRKAGRLKRALGIESNFGLLGRMDQFNRRQSAYPEMSAKMRAELKAQFGPDIKRLENVTGRRFDTWYEAR